MTKKKTDAEKQEKMVEVELTETLVKYDFSQDELIHIGEQVAGFAEKLATLDAEAKQVAKQYKADIEGVELQQDRLIRFIRDKFEFKNMECLKVVVGKLKKVLFFRTDKPETEAIRTLTLQHFIDALMAGALEPAKERNARPSELQLELPMEQPEGDEG